jgi:aldehyde dehydrogenase
MRTALDEIQVSEIVREVVSALGHAPARLPVAALKPACHGCAGPCPGRHFGVFTDVSEACEAAGVAFRQLQAQGLAGRARIVELVKRMAVANAEPWGRLEFEETRIGRLEHKIEKLRLIRAVPGLEFLHPDSMSGDHGITLEEYTPFGVIGVVTPSTHSVPTLTSNVISMVAAGNALVVNPHPSAARAAATAARAYNEAIFGELGIENLISVMEHPTLEGFGALSGHPEVKLLCITGGPAVVKAALGVPKRAICAGPGNPPVLVDDTVDLDSAARKILLGAAYDNNLFCIAEKEVFVVGAVADRFLAALGRAGAHRLGAAEIERLTRAAFDLGGAGGAGCAHPVLSRKLVGQAPRVLAEAAGVRIPDGTELLYGETEPGHPFVMEEQMMPFLPVVRVKDVEEGIHAAQVAERGYRHTAIIHSLDVSRMTAMARALDTTIFVKNGPCVAGLGVGGEGYMSYTIATPTGEGVTNPRTFTRVRRCVMVDNLRIY